MFQVNPLRTIHIKNQALFSSKDNSKKLQCRMLQFLFGALRVNPVTNRQLLANVSVFVTE